jgi:hypothetical protein
MGAIYSDTKRAEVLASLKSHGGNIGRTAREHQIPESTVRLWRDGDVKRLHTPEATELCARKEEELSDLWERVTRQSLGFVLGDMGELSMYKEGYSGVVRAAAIGTDKLQLLQGKPTSINETQTLTDDLRRERLNRLADKATERLIGADRSD